MGDEADVATAIRGGAWPVVPTPFRAGDGAVDGDALHAIVRRLSRTGISGLWLLGVGAEQSRLTEDEQDLVLDVTLETDDGCPLAVGVTSDDESLMVRRAERFARRGDVAVFDLEPAVSGATPQDAVRRMSLLSATGIRTLAYIDTGQWELSDVRHRELVTVIDKLWRLPLAGVKLACRDFRLWVELCRRARAEGLLVYTASGRLTVPALSVGASGVVADDVTVVPEQYVRLIRAWTAGAVDEARILHEELVGLGRALSEVGVASAKYALALQGLCSPLTRGPLGVPPGTKEEIEAELRRLGCR